MTITNGTNPLRRVVRLAVLGALVAASTIVAAPAQAVPAVVAAKDNRFDPQEVRIDPGDSVTWRNEGARTHDVTSDEKGEFNSGDMESGDTFSHTFQEEGYYFYFCRFHGSKGRVGMWGVVIVGDPPPPPELEEERDVRPKLVVPDDFPTIQKAVDAAHPGSTVLIKPGIYHEDVIVQTPRLVIKGVDRFRTVLHGRDELNTGITVDNAHHVTVANLTVRNYTGNGVYFNRSDHYRVTRVDAIKGRTYGIYAFDSYHGVFENSFAWGSGDGAFYIGQCLGCSALIQNVYGGMSYLGYSGTNSTGVVIRNSVWENNGAGIVPNTLPTEEDGPNRGTFIYNNIVRNNNYGSVPPAGFSDTVGIPFGTGIWLAGIKNGVVKNNIVRNHDRYGILVTHAIAPDTIPMNNEVRRNKVRGSGLYDLAWDGWGADNCFSHNDIEGDTGPPMIQTLYACPNRPFVGVPYAPVDAEWMSTLLTGHPMLREQSEPPEPKRPRCQKGRPGCDR